MRVRRGFSLIELLAVIGIVTILAALLFPVFASAKESSRRAVCLSNLRQIASATFIYATDYDDRLVLVNHQPAGQGNSRTDRTWVQLTLPYTRNFSIFRCPSDSTDRPRPESTYDEDLVPGDLDSRYYSASMRSNYGYNYQNLAPIVQSPSGWIARPREMTSIASPSQTLLFVDSVWSRDRNGTPYGGGNWLVVPPCRYYASAIDSFTGTMGGRTEVFTTSIGWNLRVDSAPEIYGNAWPWHTGKMNLVRLDGSVRNLTPEQLTKGCEVGDSWTGRIRDASTYIWDIQ